MQQRSEEIERLEREAAMSGDAPALRVSVFLSRDVIRHIGNPLMISYWPTLTLHFSGKPARVSLRYKGGPGRWYLHIPYCITLFDNQVVSVCYTYILNKIKVEAIRNLLGSSSASSGWQSTRTISQCSSQTRDRAVQTVLSVPPLHIHIPRKDIRIIRKACRQRCCLFLIRWAIRIIRTI